MRDIASNPTVYSGTAHSSLHFPLRQRHRHHRRHRLRVGIFYSDFVCASRFRRNTAFDSPDRLSLTRVPFLLLSSFLCSSQGESSCRQADKSRPAGYRETGERERGHSRSGTSSTYQTSSLLNPLPLPPTAISSIHRFYRRIPISVETIYQLEHIQRAFHGCTIYLLSMCLSIKGAKVIP